MAIDSIWSNEGGYLQKKSKGFKARSTGCSCCSSTLDTKEEVRENIVDTLTFIYRACRFFKWDFKKLYAEAEKQVKLKDKTELK